MGVRVRGEGVAPIQCLEAYGCVQAVGGWLTGLAPLAIGKRLRKRCRRRPPLWVRLVERGRPGEHAAAPAADLLVAVSRAQLRVVLIQPLHRAVVPLV